MTENQKSCSVCASPDQATMEAREMMFGTNRKFSYSVCGACGVMHLQNIPSDWSEYYPADYYSFSSPPKRNPVVNFLRKARNRYALEGRGLIGGLLYRRSAHDRLRSLIYLDGIKKDSAILDVGCGSGDLLRDLQQLGFRNLLGIEPYLADDITYDGLTIYKKSLEEIAGSFDVIMLHHVFEHMANPHEILSMVAKRLSPFGQCLIRIPMADSYAFKHYRENWVQLDAPRHVFLHTVKSMNKLCDQAGLKVQKVVFDSSAFQFWGSELYKKNISLFDSVHKKFRDPRDYFSVAELQAYAAESARLNEAHEGDQAVMIINKA